MALQALYLFLWALAAMASGIAHMVAPLFMSQGAAWPFSVGWQREISFFDFFIAAQILFHIRHGSVRGQMFLVKSLAALSFVLGGNHFYSATTGHWGYVHSAGVIANSLAVVVAIGLICRQRGSSPNSML